MHQAFDNLFSWSQVSLGALRLGGPNQVHSNCLLCSLSPPPKRDAGRDKWSHSLPVGCPVSAWHGQGRLVRNHWKRSNLGGICFITQLLLPNVSFAQHSNWFQLTHGRALARESSCQEGCVVPTMGDTTFQRSSAGKRARRRAARSDYECYREWTECYRESSELVGVRKCSQISLSATHVESLLFRPERALLLQIY